MALSFYTAFIDFCDPHSPTHPPATPALDRPTAQRNLMVVLLQEFLSLASIKRLLKALARALKHLHDNGKIHGDLKPLNVVRMRDGTW